MIVAVGGGEIRDNETRSIDDFIVNASGKPRPRVLFFPTAAHDAPGYTRTVAEYFQAGWGCEVRSLELTRNPSPKTVAAELEWADVINVGGGDTNFLLKTWTRHAMKPQLEAALARGVVLSGVSAGAICWFDGGIAAYNGYKPLPGLGFVPGILLPHFKPDNTAALDPWLNEHPDQTLWGVEDRAALTWDGASFSVVSDGGRVWKVSTLGVTALS